MSRESEWKRLGYFIGSARNPNYDRLRGLRNSKCGKCFHFHALGQTICKLLMTEHNKEENTFRFYKCNCNSIQEVDQVV